MSNIIQTGTWGKNSPPHGIAPALALIEPRFPHNVGMAVRLASCYGLTQVWFTGSRVSLHPAKGQRLPREERMKGYRDVQMIHYEFPLDQFDRSVVPVAVEVRANSEPLQSFEHPDNAVYVFGPEDGSISTAVLHRCHRFVVIPTRHCLNLATAVATVLWDRHYKAFLAGKGDLVTPGQFEQRGLAETPEDIVFSVE
jgi:tRNA(Leu) C34 or U34 (ribose-2'-O)-methylase TrmL